MPEKIHEVIETENGYITFKEKPSEKELAEYYKNKYFQEEHGNYKVKYDAKELKHKKFICNLIAEKAMQLFPQAKTVYDIACGEGFLSYNFFKRNLNVKTCDYTNAIDNFFPELSRTHIQGDLFEISEKEFSSQKFDILTLISTLEHVLNPEELIELIKKGMTSESILVITVPNDFSELQKTLVDSNQMRYGRWLGYPAHLNFFNTETFPLFIDKMGLKVVSKIAEFPIDIFMLNDLLNYDKEPAKGKLVYSIVRDFDLYLSKLNVDKVLKFYESFAELGLGRSITYYCKLK